jgi:hypothetical protein
MMTTGQLRREAHILRTRYNNAEPYAALLEAQADYYDTIAGRELQPAQTEPIVVEMEYPIIGRCKRVDGDITTIEHEWRKEHNAVLNARGIYVTFEWCYDPIHAIGMSHMYSASFTNTAVPRGAQALTRIYIGTVADGPRVQWSENGWRRLKSNKNYGKKYAHGGTWSSTRETFATLAEADPEINAAIEEVRRLL